MENERSDLPTQAHFTQRNSPIFQKDSDFEIFVDMNGNHHHYKEFEANAINTVWNLMLDKPYADGGMEHSARVASDPSNPLYYEVHQQKTATKVIRGTLNDPDGHGATWSIEVALSYEDLWSHVQRYINDEEDTAPYPPMVGSMKRLNFSRVERRGDINWTWQPQRVWDPNQKRFVGFVDMHRPDAWGYLVFGPSKDTEKATKDVNEESSREDTRDPTWPARLAAMNLYYAQQAYFEQSSEASYAASLHELQNLVDPTIIGPFDITLQTHSIVNPTTFKATVVGNPDGSVISVTHDRHIEIKRPQSDVMTKVE